LTIYLFIAVPKGFFPQQDTGCLLGSIEADQDTSFQAMNRILLQMIDVVKSDPAVAYVLGFTGGGAGTTTNTARMFVTLKPLEQRNIHADQIIARLRPQLAKVVGATLYLQAFQDVRAGGRLSNAQYQFTLYTAARFGISAALIDTILYDAFGQRQVSTMYTNINQYHVVMEAAPEFWQDPGTLNEIYVRSPSGQAVPLSAFTYYRPTTALWQSITRDYFQPLRFPSTCNLGWHLELR
jgi:multidrug efflux pump